MSVLLLLHFFAGIESGDQCLLNSDVLSCFSGVIMSSIRSVFLYSYGIAQLILAGIKFNLLPLTSLIPWVTDEISNEEFNLEPNFRERLFLAKLDSK